MDTDAHLYEFVVPMVPPSWNDCHTHWMLTHFLLDGHHRMQAAADTGRPLRLLSLLSVDAGLAIPSQVRQALTARATQPRPRNA